MKLREYQQNAINLIEEGLTKNLRQLCVSPTGSGKTVIFSEICRREAAKNKKCLILTDRKELLNQALDKIGNASIISRKNKSLGLINISMVETYSNLTTEQPDLIIIDECHKGNFAKIIKKMPDVPVLGFTATPVGKLGDIYSSMIELATIRDLIKDGFLCSAKTYKMQQPTDLVIENGEYTDKSQIEYFEKKNIFSGFEEQILKTEGKNLVFCVNIEHCISVYEKIKAIDDTTAIVTSETSKEDRPLILKDFREGKIKTLINCGILTTGYDEPTVKNIFVLRATESLALWLQMGGRGSRPIKGDDIEKYGIGEKDSFTIYDYGGNADRHGVWELDREWILEKTEPKKKKAGRADVIPLKNCPKCDSFLPISAKTCIFCGHTEERIYQEGELVLCNPVDISSISFRDLDHNGFYQLYISKKINKNYLFRILRTLGEDHLAAFASLAGFKKEWVNFQRLQPKGFLNKFISQL